MTKLEALVNFLVEHGYDREDVLEHGDAWLRRQDMMDNQASFKDQIVLSYKKRKGELLTPSEEEYLDYLNTILSFVD